MKRENAETMNLHTSRSLACLAFAIGCAEPDPQRDAATAMDAVAADATQDMADATRDMAPDATSLDVGTEVARGQLLYRQDFESDGWQDEFTGRSTWEPRVAVVTHAPHGGARSLRGNQMADVVDPITGLPGRGNVLLDWRGAGHDIHERTPHELYFSYWFRHDDFSYAGEGEGKLLYFVDAEGCSTRAMYLGGQLHQRDLFIAYDNGCGSNRWAHCANSVHGADVCDPCRADGTCDNWGYSGLYLRNPEVAPAAGLWRHFEYHVDYGARRMRFWVDSHPITHARYPDGRIAYGPERTFRWTGFQLFYASTSDGRDFPECVSGEGACAGWQIDDLEVWDGMPDLR